MATLVGAVMKLSTVLLFIPPDQYRGHGVRPVVGRLGSPATVQRAKELSTMLAQIMELKNLIAGPLGSGECILAR
jgi:hypothetical protein